MRTLVLPILVPFSTAALLMLAPKRPGPQRWISLAGSVLLLVSTVLVLARVSGSGVQVLQVSGWPAPFGITLVADLFAPSWSSLAGVVGTASSSVLSASIDRSGRRSATTRWSTSCSWGSAAAFLTGDLFNLYVWFEVMLMASFVLLALGGERPQMDGGIKYVTINLMSSAMFLAALGICSTAPPARSTWPNSPACWPGRSARPGSTAVWRCCS